jgi:hypothetical protein
VAVALRVTPTSSRGATVGYYTRATIESELRVKDLGGAASYERQVLAARGYPDPDGTLAALQQAVEGRYKATHDVKAVAMKPAVGLDGYTCIDRYLDLASQGKVGLIKMNDAQWCAGDTRDAAYVGGGPDLAFDLEEGDMVVVVGVNHVQTSMATYVNVAITDRSNYSGVGALLHSQLSGSAAVYLPTLGAGADNFYVATIARACPQGIPACLELPSDLPLEQGVSVALRAYVNPQTKVGSHYPDLVLARAVHLTRR